LAAFLTTAGPTFLHASPLPFAPVGIFVDKVLTHSETLIPLDALDAKYKTAPLNLQTLNDFANEYFFLSELASDGIVSIRRSYDVLAPRFVSNPRLLRLLGESLSLVTIDGVWFYGRHWDFVQQNPSRTADPARPPLAAPRRT
jgi:hypothetical protein